MIKSKVSASENLKFSKKGKNVVWDADFSFIYRINTIPKIPAAHR